MIKGRAHVTFSQLEAKWPLLGWPCPEGLGVPHYLKVFTERIELIFCSKKYSPFLKESKELSTKNWITRGRDV